MAYQLRDYQQRAVDFAVPRLKQSAKPLLMSIGTGAGKTWIISEMAKRWGEKVLVLTVSKELCLQDYEKLKIVNEGESIGLYSASWKQKSVEKITVATVQSACKHPELWEDYSLLILDECDCFPLDGCVSELISKKRVCGLTATSYATTGSRQGDWFTTKIYPIHKIKSKTHGWFWKPVEFQLSEKDLLEMGYLCPMKIYSSPINCGRLRLQSNGGEYTAESISAWALEILERIVQVMEGAEKNNMCRSGLVFMPSVESCLQLEVLCKAKGLSVGSVTYKTNSKVRDGLVESHRKGEIKWLISQGCLARGFDSPATDCLILARPTKSLRLHRQILGRGLRMADGKKVCYVFDLTENCKTWGGPEDVEIGKNEKKHDTILLRGKDISGMEVSVINVADIANRKKEIIIAGEEKDNGKGRKNDVFGCGWSRTKSI